LCRVVSPQLLALCLSVCYGIRCFIYLHIVQVMSGEMRSAIGPVSGSEVKSSLTRKSRGMIGFA
jgi:hypothetical protein